MMSGESRIPHSLRLAILFLRVVLGANFIYLGWSELFNPPSLDNIHIRSFAGIYAWLASVHNAAVIEWFLVAAGVCLIFGFATRFVSILLLLLTLLSYWPAANSAWSATQLTGDTVIIILCLAILFLGKAGNYLGLDTVFHFSFRHKK